MKTKHSLFSTLAALVVASAAPAAGAAEEHHHHAHGAAAPQTLQLDGGKKWKTDGHLRQAMNDINQAMAKAVPLIHENRFADDDYRTLATTVGQKVAYAVEHCKLSPKADAMLHLVIADLMSGAEAMEGKRADLSRHDGAVAVLKALDAYGKHFQHQGWKLPRG